jgi:Trypsin-co-occurring domain 1
MAYVIEIPVEAGGRLLVQARADDLPDTLELAALRPGEVVARARESVEEAIDQIKPAINAVTERLKAVAADEVAVEFGIVLGAEAGAVIAKGTAEVHFTVTLSWKRGPSGEQTSGEGRNGA